MFTLLLALVVAGPNPPQMNVPAPQLNVPAQQPTPTGSPEYSVTVLEDTRTASSHTCKFEFTNRSTSPLFVITVGVFSDAQISELEFPPVNWALKERTQWPNLSPKGWFESSGSTGPPQTPFIRYSLGWQSDSKDADLQPGKTLEFVLRMNPQERVGCNQLHWRSLPRPDQSVGSTFGTKRAPNTLEEKIDQAVQKVNSQLTLGRVMQREPSCADLCVFETVFLDAQDRVRKIVEWAEGTRQATSKSSITLRSIWETYYDTDGSPMLLSGRYEGEPNSTDVQQHLVYIQDGRVIRNAMTVGSQGQFTAVPPPPRDDVVARSRAKFIATEKWMNSNSQK